MTKKDGLHGPCKICHSFCKRGNPDECRMYVWNDCYKSAVFPCNAREYVNNNTTKYLRFACKGCKYHVNISKWPIKTVVSGKAWRKFIKDNDLGEGTVVLFDLSNPLRTATILNAEDNPADEIDNMVVDEAEEVDYADESELSVEHSKSVRLKRDEQDRPNAFILGYNMEYGGTPFVHQFTKTNIATGNMKLPSKLAKILCTPKEGKFCVSSSKGGFECEVSYNTSSDGRIIFRKVNWLKFVSNHFLEAGKPELFYFKKASNQGLKLDLVVCKI